MPEGEATETRTCTECDADIEYLGGIGWVDIETGGTYDICPGRFDARTDTNDGHVPTRKG